VLFVLKYINSIYFAIFKVISLKITLISFVGTYIVPRGFNHSSIHVLYFGNDFENYNKYLVHNIQYNIHIYIDIEYENCMTVEA